MNEPITRRKLLADITGGALLAASGLLAEPLSAAAQAAQRFASAPFDIHQHLESTDASYSPLRAFDELIGKDFAIRTKIMDENGIGQSVMMVSTQYRRTEGIKNTMQVNDLVAEYVARHSDRFPVGVGTVEVTHGEASLKELERMAKDLKFRGVVWHHTHSGVQVDDAFMRPILKQVAALRLIPFIHVGLKPYESLSKLEVLAEEFPQVTFVALAALARSDDADEALNVGRRQKNILFDTGPVIYTREKGVEAFVKLIGPDRLLLGSDLYASRPSYRRATTTLEIVKNSIVGAEDKAKILYGNARRLLGV